MFRCCARRMQLNFEYLIVGGGNAAGYACREFVAQGVGAGRVGVVMAEPVLPYERPALTKAYLHPPTAKVRARLPGFHTCVGGGGERQLKEWYEEHGIELVKGKAMSVDFKSKCVTVGDDQQCTYGKLILATGCSALRVSKFGVKGDDLANVFYLREESDAAALVQALEALPEGKGQAVIVGGGYIGLECAAALVGWGIDTTMVLPEANVMPRLFNAELGKWMEDQYMARGIKIAKGEIAAEFTGTDGILSGVTLKSGQSLPCNISVVGVGSTPNVDYCQGLKMDSGGFAVDEFMRTSEPEVFAIGDICAFPSQYGGLTRCEHVDHARKSAAQAVKAAMDVKTEPYKYLPYFYSRIFEYTPEPIAFNFFGDQSGDCHVSARGDKSVGAVWLKDGKVVGALLMGSPGPSPEDAKKLSQLATETPAALDAAAAFSVVGL